MEVGTIHEILVETKVEIGSEYPYKGRTATNKVVHFKGDYRAGDFAQVKIVRANPHSLYGEGVIGR